MTQENKPSPEWPKAVHQAQQFVLRLYSQQQDARLVLHNYAFASALADQVAELARLEEAPAAVQQQAMLAAWFLPVGRLFDYHQPAPYSLRAAQQCFQQLDWPPADQQQVLAGLQRVMRGEQPVNAAERILSDALAAATFITDSEQRLPLLQLERELVLQKRLGKAEWARELLDELLRVRWHTHHGQAHFQPLLAQAVHRQRASLEKRIEKEEVLEGRYLSLERRIPVRGAQTFFRTNYRNHINLSAIADNKANIMISVNAILVSVLITFLSYRNIGENSPQILLPVVVFLVTGLASLIFAVLSARPKVTRLNGGPVDMEQAKRNIVFFGNFVTLELEQYEDAMDELFQDAELLYGNMVRDMYYLGKVLDKKYRYLSVSYTIFMVGFIATVGLFLFALFT